MSSDLALIEALEKVVELDPMNAAVRTRLAELLLASGDAEAALTHVQQLLASYPDSSSILNLAADACEKLGHDGRAAAYRRMRDALAGQMIGQEMEPVGHVSGMPKAQPNTDERWPVIQSDLKLEDVAGLDQVKERLRRSFFGPLERPELREAFGQTPRGGLLLYGPPGCGKTFLAKAIAGELGAGFMSIAITDLLDPWFGNSEKLMSLAFRTGRSRKPCVLFFDEVDAIARKRTEIGGNAGRGLVNHFLAELDGVESQNDGLYVLAATNHPWDLDNAIRRPGRFDRTLFVSPPDPSARFGIAQRILSKIPHSGVDTKWIADQTDNFSGADVAHLCNSAAELALEESMNSSRICPVEVRHLKSALKEIRPSMRPWFETAKNYAKFANDGGEYDDLMAYLKTKRIA